MNLPIETGNNATEMVNTSSENEKQYLTFFLKDEMYSLDILNIKEILEYGAITKVPMMPDFIRGVINLRGSVVPVIDLSARFTQLSSDVTKKTCIVIMEITNHQNQQQDIGIVVDSVSEVLETPSIDIEPTPAFGSKIRADFILGVGKINGDFIIILNIEKILSTEELSAISAAQSAGGKHIETIKTDG